MRAQWKVLVLALASPGGSAAKVAKAIAGILDVDLPSPRQFDPGDLSGYG